MTTPLQQRAEKLADQFKAHARAPIVVEFAGLPKAGKTTVLGQVQAFLRRCGFRVEVVVERASVCPIRDKKHANFNVWTACTTLAQVLEKTQTPPRPDDPEILILDRGLFDSVCWLSVLEGLSRIRKRDREAIERFVSIEDWCRRISGVILMVADPHDSMERDQGHLPVDGKEGSIMNHEVLSQMKFVIERTAEQLGSKFQIFSINTSSRPYKSDQRKTCEDAAGKILDWVEFELSEEILSIEKSKILDLFRSRSCVDAAEAAEIIDWFHNEGTYNPRHDVEENLERVQALPVVVVRNKTGDVLRLRRRERSETSALHEKVVIWAGGHVRKEDKKEGRSIENCAVRELEEELRLCVEPNSLGLLGAVYTNSSEGTSKHVALVYEWRANTDDVAVALSNSEFFERRGNSLSGTFVSTSDLVRMEQERLISEDWSSQIVRNILFETKKYSRADLFD